MSDLVRLEDSDTDRFNVSQRNKLDRRRVAAELGADIVDYLLASETWAAVTPLIEQPPRNRRNISGMVGKIGDVHSHSAECTTAASSSGRR